MTNLRTYSGLGSLIDGLIAFKRIALDSALLEFDGLFRAQKKLSRQRSSSCGP